jgi:hypothetical protein
MLEYSLLWLIQVVVMLLRYALQQEKPRLRIDQNPRGVEVEIPETATTASIRNRPFR